MSVEDWFAILNWKKLPNFGDVHILEDTDDMAAHYYFAPLLKDLLNNLLVGLRGEYPSHNYRLLGLPGVGKTSFIYYLIRILETQYPEIKSKYEFYVLHGNRVVTDKVDANMIMDRIYQALMMYYEACKISKSVHQEIEANQNLSLKEKINKLLDYYLSNKSKFGKRLIFILDDIDIIDKDLVAPLAKEILKHSEPHSIRKWLCVRNTSYDLYDKETIEFINTFFPEPHVFPLVRLYDIIDRRIQIVGTKSKPAMNPFSEGLCSELQNALNFDHRQGLSILKKILDENSPGQIPAGTAVDFIRQYINRALLQTLLNNHLIPNVFDTRVTGSTFFPLEKEIICLLCHRQTFDVFFFGIIEEELNIRLTTIRRGNHEHIQIRAEDFQTSMDFLCRHNIIERKSKSVYFLTSRGQFLSKIVGKQYYQELCKKQLSKEGVVLDGLYWDLTQIESHYEVILLEDYLRKL